MKASVIIAFCLLRAQDGLGRVCVERRRHCCEADSADFHKFGILCRIASFSFIDMKAV